MLTKLETKSERVKGLSFHNKRPWILASLHTGLIQLWDYRMGALIDRFEEHEGPVRGVCFHCSQPLFVSGGDDFTIKVWNYKLRHSIFTLLGHTDYIRTVQFHHENPWIVSASDDLTIRIWNWQSRTCISVLTGHNHYVMCASFHPKEDLVVSASLDQTVRVWEINSAVVKYVLEGHNRGVNSASFHPSLPLIVSGSDDREVKIWQMNDTTAWEVNRFRGHTDNVSCVLFHHKQDIIVSNSEDKTIRVWDATKRTCLHTFHKNHDRFWTLASHPETNLFAAGHDSGLIVFKVQRERPPFSATNDSLYYVKDRFLRLLEYSSQNDTQLIPIHTPSPKTLSFSPTENAILISSDVDEGSYELHIVPKDGSTVQEAKRGVGVSPLFVARNKFAILDKTTNEVLVKNLKNEIVKKCALPLATDVIFYAGTGNLLCRGEDKVFIFDLQQRLVLALGDIKPSLVKYVIWSNDMESVALLGKNSIVITDKKLVPRCTVHERNRVKSGSWDDKNHVFIYTTVTHIKYCLPNGENGIIKSLDVPIYITKVLGNTLFFLDRDLKNRSLVLDSTEYVFKVCLLTKRYDHVMSMVRKLDLCGQAMIAYLTQKGFPEIALNFVKDERTRFDLALESGNIQIALDSAKKIDEKSCWYRLGVEALRLGNAGVSEYAYQRTRSFERLSFLYLITGNLEKLSKMMKIAEVEHDVMGQFRNALFLGDVRERIKILVNAGQLKLAYACAKTHGLNDVAEELAEKLENVPCLRRNGSVLVPPMPVLRGGDWPLVNVTKEIFEDLEALDIVDHEEPGWDLEDLELPPEDLGPPVFFAPGEILVQNSPFAGEHAAAGNFDTAMKLLINQLGIRNFTPLKPFFTDLHLGSETYLRAFPSAPSLALAPRALVFTFSRLKKNLEAGMNSTTSGKFTEALGLFRVILHTIPLIVVESLEHVEEVKKMIFTAKEYVLGLQMELKRRELKENQVRQQELAAYFTHCKLEPRHLRLALMNAMTVCYKAGNVLTASHFATRLLETSPTDPNEEKQNKTARLVLQAAEKNMTDKTQLSYDFRSPFVICGATYVPIYWGQRDVVCPYCGSRFVVSQEGEICAVCEFAVVGSDGSGLLCSPAQIG